SPTLEILPSTQNSFAYLQTVLGARPAEPGYRVATADTIDPAKINSYQPQTDTLPNTNYFSHSGTISRPGDYDVSRWTAPRDETLQVRVYRGSAGSLNQVLLVYDAAGNPVFLQDSTSPATSFKVAAGMTYYFVVGGKDGNSTGDYVMDITQETHEFFVTINSLTDPILVDPTLWSLSDSVQVRINGEAGLYWSDNVYHRLLPVTANEGKVDIEIDVERIWHGKPILGTVKLVGDEWYVDFHDGTGLHDTGVDSSHDLPSEFYTHTNPPTGTRLGQVWEIDLT